MNDTTIVVSIISYLISLLIVGRSVYMRTDSEHNFLEDCLFAMCTSLAISAIVTALFVNFLKVVLIGTLLMIAFSITMGVMWGVKKLFGEKK